MKPIFIAACAILSSLGAPGAVAQEHEHAHDAAALGTVNFPVSCNAEAQRRFNTAASLLYSFHWEKVDAAIAAVLEADAGCAMAYWAKAIESLDNPLGAPPTPKLEQQGWAAVEKAKQLGGKTQRERDYIAAVETVFKDHERFPSRPGRRPTRRLWSSYMTAIRRIPKRPSCTRSGCRSPRIATTRRTRSN